MEIAGFQLRFCVGLEGLEICDLPKFRVPLRVALAIHPEVPSLPRKLLIAPKTLHKSQGFGKGSVGDLEKL